MNPRKYQIEKFIGDWHWDEKSHAFAFEMGAFLFGFMDFMLESGLSDKTINKHKSNTWCIGNFSCKYDFHEQFSPQIFKYPPFHETEFKRKVSDSAYALQSYQSTCNKLAKYVKDEGWESLPEYDFELSEDIEDFCIGLELLKANSRRRNPKLLFDLTAQVNALSVNYVVHLRDVHSRDEFMERMKRCCDALDEIGNKLNAMSFDNDYFRTKISAQLKEDALEILKIIEITMMNI